MQLCKLVNLTFARIKPNNGIMDAVFSDRDKKFVESTIVQTIIGGLDKGVLKQEELSPISNFVLDKIDNIKNKGELVDFCRELSGKWVVFKNLETIVEGVVEDAHEDTAASQILAMAKEGNIEQAIDLAKNTMENTHAIAND